MSYYRTIELGFEYPRGYRDRYDRKLTISQWAGGGQVEGRVSLTISLPKSQVLAQSVNLTKPQVLKIIALLTKALIRWP